MMAYSALVNGVDLRESYGIIVEKVEDVLMPAVRRQTVMVPGRAGVYDFDAEDVDEREVRLQCAGLSLSRAQVRELAYLLRKKGSLQTWDDPHKTYTGRVNTATDIEKILSSGRRFTLIFDCEPYAKGDLIDATFERDYEPNYAATAPTPARIQITNTGTAPITGVQITVYKRHS